MWTVGNVASGGNVALDMTVTVNATGPYNNTAEISAANEADPDSTPGNGAGGEDDVGRSQFRHQCSVLFHQDFTRPVEDE